MLSKKVSQNFLNKSAWLSQSSLYATKVSMPECDFVPEKYEVIEKIKLKFKFLILNFSKFIKIRLFIFYFQIKLPFYKQFKVKKLIIKVFF